MRFEGHVFSIALRQGCQAVDDFLPTRVAWFARALTWWRATKARVRAAVARARAWRVARAVARRWRNLLHRMSRAPADPV